MSRDICQVRLVHASIRHTYEGATNGGWNTTISNKRPGVWVAIDYERSPVTLACQEYDCGAQLAVHLNPPSERQAFRRSARKRRVKKLGVGGVMLAVAALIRLIGGEALQIPAALLSCAGSVTCIVLLLMIAFGGRMPRYSTESVGEPEASGVTHLVEVAP